MTVPRLDRYDVAWAVWAGAAVGAFAVIERSALRSGVPGASLSENARQALGVYPSRRGGSLALAALAAGSGWLVAHLARCQHDREV